MTIAGVAITTDQDIDLDVDQGVPFSWAIPTGEDPTGWTVDLEIRDQPVGLVYAALAAGTGVTLGGPDDFNLYCRLTAAQVALLPVQAVWDVLVTPVEGDEVRLASGSVYLSLAVAR